MKASKTAPAAILLTALVAIASLVALLVPPPAKAVSRSFFGIVPQTGLTEQDAEYMRAARIGSVRWPFAWSGAQPDPQGFEWGPFDEIVTIAARQRLRILPFVYSTPSWVTRKFTVMPVNNGRQRRAWSAFLAAAVERYGPRGDFWAEHGPGTPDPLPRMPIVDWQIWNEANFFYFTTPASPTAYARLVKLSDRAMRRADPAARLMLSGLFAEPSARPPRAMHATDFLDRLYGVPGIKRSFEGVALHPYAEDAADLERMTEGLRSVMVRNGDPGARLYMTEMGWGSQHNPNLVSFEQGVGFQLREMRLAYRYLIGNRGRLNLKGTYWFTWKDVTGSCNFCDSTGFFRRNNGPRLKPKAAWRTFVDITGGRARP
ncbi:MAG TPA: beta-galactosidase [Solirubrobacterales bacterium]|nr:beta-galactosidase [Solirubrobacterales bacterium]